MVSGYESESINNTFKLQVKKIMQTMTPRHHLKEWL